MSERKVTARLWIAYVLAALSLLGGQSLAYAETAKNSVRVAVATNFVTTLKALREDFASLDNGKILISAGSTGKLYAQIRQGAPYDIFLAADQQRPQLLEQHGLTVTDSRFTYANGALVLWRPNKVISNAEPRVISNTKPRATNEDEKPTAQTEQSAQIRQWLASASSIALANPRLAPYGFAAQQVLQNLQSTQSMSQRQVMGENVGQTFSLVATGNARMGFVAAAQMLEQNQPVATYLIIPSKLHSPILQDGVLLKFGANNKAAARFMHYLASSRAQEIIRKAGFSRPDLRRQ
ncbi:MAG: molybdate ABC transporter substrate-binding protein [Gammaproteobacteria bacterium]|jgi:molybdate transport system substrate-binding protein|nr:molybdate ABC transporter substrate-binding protein [Gammaproteobacteria bacterium]